MRSLLAHRSAQLSNRPNPVNSHVTPSTDVGAVAAGGAGTPARRPAGSDSSGRLNPIAAVAEEAADEAAAARCSDAAADAAADALRSALGHAVRELHRRAPGPPHLRADTRRAPGEVRVDVRVVIRQTEPAPVRLTPQPAVDFADAVHVLRPRVLVAQGEIARPDAGEHRLAARRDARAELVEGIGNAAAGV